MPFHAISRPKNHCSPRSQATSDLDDSTLLLDVLGDHIAQFRSARLHCGLVLAAKVKHSLYEVLKGHT